MIDIEKLVDEIVTPWVFALGNWKPSGRGVAGVCSTCVDSPFASMAHLEAWPHEVTHPLVGRLATAARRVELAFIDSAAAVDAETRTDMRHRLYVYERHARVLVEHEFSRYLADVAAELEMRLGPVLARYLEAEAGRAVDDIETVMSQPGSSTSDEGVS